MDAATQKAITDKYRGEYRAREVAEAFSGRQGFGRSWRAVADRFASGISIAAIALGVMAAAPALTAVMAGALPVSALLVIGTVAAFPVLASFDAVSTFDRAAENRIADDIENGTLVARYRQELARESPPARPLAASLPQQNSLASSFRAAAKPANPPGAKAAPAVRPPSLS